MYFGPPIFCDYILFKDGREYASRKVIERGGNHAPLAKRFRVAHIRIREPKNPEHTVIAVGCYPDIDAKYGKSRAFQYICLGQVKDIQLLHERKPRKRVTP